MSPIGAGPIFSSGAAAFDPITSINWVWAVWAEGTEFNANGGGGNGSTVATWHDEISTRNLTQTGESYKPIYRTGGINSLPSVEFDATDDQMTATSNNWTEPYSVVAIGKYSNVNTSSHTIINTNDFYNRGIWTNSGNWVASGTDTGDADDANCHLFTLYLSNGTSDVFELDGTSIASGSFSNAGTWASTVVGNGWMASPWAGHIAFLGIYSGDVRSHGSWQQFEDWSERYGMTVA